MSTYVYEFKPNNKVCAGVVVNQADYIAYQTEEINAKEYMEKIDPESLFLVTEEKEYPEGDDVNEQFNKPGDFYSTEEGAMSECRSWYDKWSYEGTYCCQMQRTKKTYKKAVAGEDDEYDYNMEIIGPFSSTKADSLEMITADLGDKQYYWNMLETSG